MSFYNPDERPSEDERVLLTPELQELLAKYRKDQPTEGTN